MVSIRRSSMVWWHHTTIPYFIAVYAFTLGKEEDRRCLCYFRANKVRDLLAGSVSASLILCAHTNNRRSYGRIFLATLITAIAVKGKDPATTSSNTTAASYPPS